MVSLGGGRDLASLFRLIIERRAMTSMLGLLEAREACARERVEVLREEAARAAAALEAGEVELDRRVIAREEFVDALAESAAESAAATEAAGGEKVAPAVLAGPAFAPVPGVIVPPWRQELSASVLSLDNQRILNVLQDQPGGEAMRAKDIAAALGTRQPCGPTSTPPARARRRRSRLLKRGSLGGQTRSIQC
ncbi:hypothetical protein JOF59_003226 [Streptomyces clavifer]|uniref:Uncharacterized protein n=1 Tax=Streptomyces clavifer TaxID=68188 RepID=A0ABS4VAA3_9ACTN|nr:MULTISPECIES: hypothetical protein [Streptomyces]MBP2360826.1 hypothetical protein [Streptomyces clavifer]MDX2746000.1 hypothetical protein [Streptomyces sp. NRRL_B-2557]